MQNKSSKPRWNEDDFEEGAYDKSAKDKSFRGDGGQCYRIGMWGRIKDKLNKADMPGNGPNGESITYADLRKNQPVFAVDMTGDGWSVVRFLPEETITVTKEDGTEEIERKTPSVVFIQAMIPTSYWEPNPDWATGTEPTKGLSAADAARQRDWDIWSDDRDFKYPPQIPERLVLESSSHCISTC